MFLCYNFSNKKIIIGKQRVSYEQEKTIYGNGVTGSSQMTAKVNNTAIPCSVGTLTDYLKENTEFMHVPKGGLLNINLTGGIPESVTIEDVLLDRNGNPKTGSDAVTTQIMAVRTDI